MSFLSFLSYTTVNNVTWKKSIVENFRFTCAEREQFFLEEIARCKR